MRRAIRISIRWFCALLPAMPMASAGHAQSVLSYHGDPARTGNYVVPGLSWVRARSLRLDTDFAPQFSGNLYAQPLYWRPAAAAAGRLIVASEDNTVAAIDVGSGKTAWTHRLGSPVPGSALPCGDIDPLGITGTPVIDPRSATLFLDAMVAGAPGPRHLIFALSLADGSTLPGWPVDVGSALAAHGLRFDATVQNQRGGLAILGGRVFVPYGGLTGDCGDYHGWVVGVGLDDPRDIVAWSTTAAKGGIWGQGGIASDGESLFFATGNTRGAARWGGGEAVFRLAPDLARSNRTQDYFAAANWRALDAMDADLGSSNPLLLDVPQGGGVQRLVLALGKDAHAYLLDRADLGGIGGALVAQTVAMHPIATAAAAWPTAGAVMVAFRGRGIDCRGDRPGDALTAIEIRAGTPPSLRTAWCGELRGGGAPIVTTTDGRANPIVWILGAEGDNQLHGFRGDTGAVLFGSGRDDRLTGLHHFQTLIATRDRLYVGADGRLHAFRF